MKSLRNKVVLSAIVLAFALIATIGSTYAWFTVSNTVNVEAMTLNVQSSNSILIRVDDPNTAETDLLDLSTYSTTLTNTDILEFYNFADLANSGDDAWKLEPVTALQAGYATVDAKTLKTMEIGINFVRDLETTVAGDKNSASGKYIELTFWMYSPSADAQPIVLQDLAITSLAANSTTQAEVVRAVKLAVWAGTESAKVFGLDAALDFTFTDGLPGFYDGTVSVTTIGDDSFNALSQLPSAPFSDPITDGFQQVFYTSNATTWATSITAGAADTDKANATTVTTLASETPTLVTVRIYVEGWDGQTTNDVIAAAFSISFKFALKNNV